MLSATPQGSEADTGGTGFVVPKQAATRHRMNSKTAPGPLLRGKEQPQPRACKGHILPSTPLFVWASFKLSTFYYFLMQQVPVDRCSCGWDAGEASGNKGRTSGAACDPFERKGSCWSPSCTCQFWENSGCTSKGHSPLPEVGGSKGIHCHSPKAGYAISWSSITFLGRSFLPQEHSDPIPGNEESQNGHQSEDPFPRAGRLQMFP